MPETASECLFCKIGAKEIPADIVHSTDAVVAFRDINPKAPTHILIISRDHIESAASISDRGITGDVLRVERVGSAVGHVVAETGQVLD